MAKTSLYKGVYYRKDNPNKPWCVRVFKMFKTHWEAQRCLRFIEKTFGVKGRISLHKSSVQRGEDKAWEFVLQRCYETQYGAFYKRLDWEHYLEIFDDF